MITFSKLLNALFGTRTPSDLARSAQSQWDAWLHPCAIWQQQTAP
jgi:type VI secretion system protein VasJ